MTSRMVLEFESLIKLRNFGVKLPVIINWESAEKLQSHIHPCGGSVGSELLSFRVESN